MSNSTQMAQSGISFFDVDRLSSRIPAISGVTDVLLNVWQSQVQDSDTGNLSSPQFPVVQSWVPAQLDEISRWVDANPGEDLQLESHTSKAKRPPVRLSFEPLQEWEGYVIAITKDGFVGRLLDTTRGDRMENEEADFPFDDVSISDRELVKPGAVFRWSLGYEKTSSGNRKKASSVVFRRLPIFTQLEIQRGLEEAQAVIDSVIWK